MSPKPRVRVVAALIGSKESGFLVQRRSTGKPRGGLWEFPGGKIECGESPETALARECEEELLVKVQVGETVFSCVHPYEDMEVDLLIMRATLVEGMPTSSRGELLRWVPVAELPHLAFCEADQEFLHILSEI